MAKALSLDLRDRIVTAVSGGMSRRRATERFGVSPASAVRWCARQAASGTPAAKPMGGDRHSGRIERQADLILALVAETRDITLMVLQAKLASQGHRFAIGTLWPFFDRHGITWRKRPRTRPSRIDRTS